MFGRSDFKNNLEITTQPNSINIPSCSSFPLSSKEKLYAFQLEMQSSSVKYKTEILRLQEQVYSQAQRISELESINSQSLANTKLLRKKQKIYKLKQEIFEQSKKFSSDLQTLQQKSHKNLQDLCHKYQTDINSLNKQINLLKLSLDSQKKSSKSEVLKTVSDILASEKRKFLKKISKISAAKNEANAKLEILREELKTMNNFFQDFDKEVAYKKIDSLISVVEGLPLNPDTENLGWILSSLHFIREDFSRCQTILKLHDRVLGQKNQEIQDLKLRTIFSKPLKCSPGSSKFQTASCSPTSALNSSFFRNFSPNHIPSYSFQEDTKKNLQAEGMISEFAGLKLKYAMLQEFIMTRDNDFRIILHELRKKGEASNEFIELITKKLDETQKFLD